MDRLKEIQERRLELKKILEDESQDVDIAKISKELDDLDTEERSLKEQNASEEVKEKEQRDVRATMAQEIEAKNCGKKYERNDGKMDKEKKYTISSPEYRSAWAKKTMGLAEERFTEEEIRALGDAVTTTDTTFVASSESANGINNGGLIVPTSFREELMERIEKLSPFFNDIRKLQVAGNIELPYLFASDDAEWYTETTDTKNGGEEFKNLQLTGWELAKDIVITWKLEQMAVESFINFLLDELEVKMGKALIKATIYGNGQNKPTGVTNGLTEVTTGATPIDTIINTYQSLSEDDRIGAKAYISTNVNIAIVSYKDSNGNYPFLQGLATNSLVEVEVDPFLGNNDIIVGNPRNYILNEVTPTRVDKESTIKGRKVTYGAYGVYDGKAKPNAFAYGKYTPTV